MLCRTCRCRIARHATACGVCGRAQRPADARADLVLGDGRRVPVADELLLGRGPDSSVRLRHASVSRRHARVGRDRAGLWLEDAGSRYGTFVDGRRAVGRVRLHDGAELRLGAVSLRLERHRDELEAGRTIVLRPRGAPPAGGGDALPARPRVRAGAKLKRLPASEGARRHVLRDDSGRMLRLADAEAELVAQLDGSLRLPELLRRAERRAGPQGTARLLQLLAQLRQRGFLDDGEPPTVMAGGRLARLLRPRYLASRRAATPIATLYRRAGFALFTPGGLVALGVLAVAGAPAFALVAGNGTAALEVGGSARAGAAAFVLGRVLLVALHELAHALTLASFGRRVARAGVKSVLVFPYAFVDTTDAWLEPRAHRLQVTAAGPICDLVTAGAAALGALACPVATARDVLFQLALGGYIGTLYNLNPLLERDGYSLLADALREPGLRRRALMAARRRLAGGRGAAGERRAVLVYGMAALAWMVLGTAVAAMLAAHRLARAWPAARYAPPAVAALALVLAGLLVRRLRTQGDTR